MAGKPYRYHDFVCGVCMVSQRLLAEDDEALLSPYEGVIHHGTRHRQARCLCEKAQKRNAYMYCPSCCVTHSETLNDVTSVGCH